VAIVDPGKQKIISTRPIPKPSADINAQERMQPAQDIQTLDRRVNDFHSMLGQVSKDMKEVKETLAMLTSKENRQPNRGYGKSNKQQGPDHPYQPQGWPVCLQPKQQPANPWPSAGSKEWQQRELAE
jgi:hypothetical protein